MTGRPRGAFVELNVVHGEVMPAYARIAELAGVDLDFWVLRQNLDLGPFEGVGIDPRITPIDVDDHHRPDLRALALEEQITPDRYDFVFMGTPEPADRLELAMRLRLPRLLVSHTPGSSLPELADTTWVVLSALAAERHPDALLLTPWYAGSAEGDGDREPVFGVPGNLQVGRRNYGSLLRALSALRDDGVGPDELSVRLIGRWSDRDEPLGVPLGLDGERFFAAAERSGVGEYLTATPAPQLSHAEVRGEIGRCRYSLPLIDDFYGPTRRYLAGKGSSGFFQSVGLLSIPVANTKFAVGSGLTAFHGYDVDDVATGIRAALAADPGDLRPRLAAERDGALERSAANLAAWVERL